MFWGNFNWVWLLIICVTVSSVVSTWIRARYDGSGGDGKAHGGKRHGDRWDDYLGAEAFGLGGGTRRRLEDALRVRDEKIAALEERIRVLERIATDRASHLKDEIDRLAG